MTESRVLTIPNLVSFARLATVPVFWWLLLAESRIALAATVMLVVGGTDWIDGYLARRLGQVSRLGAMLDPVADRLMIASAVVAGLIAGVLPALIGVPLIVREALVALITLFIFSRGAEIFVVRRLGKVATFFLYGAIPAFYMAAGDVLEGIFLPAAWVTGIIGLVLYWVVLVQYLGDARSALRRLESPASPQES